MVTSSPFPTWIIAAAAVALCLAAPPRPARAAKLLNEDGTARVIADKTFVAWASPANLDQQGGSLVTLMSGEVFDALVLGEKQKGSWMAGSDFFRRTQADVSSSPVETARPGQFVQMAAVYAGTKITLYRNGEVYSKYDAGSRQTFDRRTDVLIGLRYRASGGEIGPFAGEIEEVRIYDRALDQNTIRSLKPGQPGSIKPFGMWTFDDGTVTDLMGNYPRGRLMNGATISAGKLKLEGRMQYAVISEPPGVQAGYYTPENRGSMWDTWGYYHDGTYYLYYLAGPAGHWDHFGLATSTDGVHWKEYGEMFRCREGTTWMGTGHIWEAPDFASSHQWIMNYSEWFGDKQDIMFVTSPDLLHWTKVDEKHRFVQDTRWYLEKGRWDCIDVVEKPGGGFYGYFTADPDRTKVSYPCCGFGFAESLNGISWTALPPPPGDIGGEFAGIEKFGNKYYIIISEGRVAVGDKPQGPFVTQKKNPNICGAGCDIYFPRLCHNAPGGPLVTHWYNNGTVFAGPMKAMEVDSEGTLRLKWWKNNEKLKSKLVKTSLMPLAGGFGPSIRLLDAQADLRKTNVLEGTLDLASAAANSGIYLDGGDGRGWCLLLGRTDSRFGEIGADGGGIKITQTSNRDLDFGQVIKFRLVMKEDMLELYVNDYLMNLKRARWNGRIGFIGADRDAFKDIKLWQSR